MVQIESIRMDYMKEPLGTDRMPEFCWTVKSDVPCSIQSAYRLQISTDTAFGELLYDSRKVCSDESAHVRVSGVSLRSRSRYHVRAKIWQNSVDGEETESDWSESVCFVTGMLEDRWGGSFVSAETKADKGNSKGTYLRKSLYADKDIREAFICSTALGLYQLYINGEKVGNDRMTPGWTSYNRHLCYQTYDVTSMLVKGENVIGAHLGAGWYKGMMGFIHERNNYGDQTAFLASMVIRFTDGTEMVIDTDETWIGCNSPIVFSEIYDGEIYDARLEQDGWCLPGFIPEMDRDFRRLSEAEKQALERDSLKNPYSDEEKAVQRKKAMEYYPDSTAWHQAESVPFSFEVLTAQPGSRPAIEQILPAQKLFTTPAGDRVIDFGQNLTGWVRFKVKGNTGDKAHIRCFETLDAEGNAYFDNLRGAGAQQIYICRDSRSVVHEELFSFQGFRYAKLESWPCEPCLEDFEACVVFSEMEETGHFSCSDPLINQLEHNIEWSLRGNFLDIPSDCPQRDERMGWTGDAQIFCRTASFLRNTYQFFEKWLRDVACDQTKEGGVPHIVPNTLEYHVITDWLLGQGTHSAAAWADVAVINPWTLYITYGDKRILEEQFDSMKRWIDFMKVHAADYIWNYRLQFGDWVALDAQEGSYFGATPNDLTCTAYYAYSTQLFAKACRVLGKDELAAEYERLYGKIADKFRKTFFDSSNKMTVHTQTAHIIALYFGLVPEGAEAAAVNELKELLRETDGHLVTGFVGTPYFCHALSRNGCVKEAYDLLLKEDFPSWLYQVKKGATTIWEHWDGIKPDGTMWSPDMNSFNHYAYGAVGEWLYRVVCGIEIDENRPGYRHIILAPKTDSRLTWAKGSYESVYGRVAVKWEEQDGIVTITAEVPFNTQASIILEDSAAEILTEGDWKKNSEGLYSTELGSGLWKVSYRRG